MFGTIDILCTDCGYVCGGCADAFRFEYEASYSCAGVTDAQPCPHNLGTRCEECGGNIMTCEHCLRSTCAQCVVVERCAQCDCDFCTTCRESAPCFGCGRAVCSTCHGNPANTISTCGSCGHFYCKECATETMQRCGCCERVSCTLCATFSRCSLCDDLFCALPTCVGGRACWQCGTTFCKGCSAPAADKPSIDFDDFLKRGSMMLKLKKRGTFKGVEGGDAAVATEEAEKHRKEADVQMRCLSILYHLRHDHSSAPFWMPPREGNKEISKLPPYLRTIAAQLGTLGVGTQNTSAAHFKREVDLVWANVKMFGPKEHGSALKIAAAGCKAKVDRLYSAWVVAAGRPARPDLVSCASCAVADQPPH